jgi:Glycosyltransferase Family 4
MLKVETKSATDLAFPAIDHDENVVRPEALISRLPRLLYIGDVPVESSYASAALLHRQLQAYPPDRLWVVEGNFNKPLPARQLPGVAYQTLEIRYNQLLYTRFHEWYSLWSSLRSAAWARKIPALLGGFKPEAVLTVAHGYLWVTAAEFARSNGLPLHLIVHDDWPRVARLPQPFGDRVDRQFGSIYRAAASRLCVSPFMREAYRARYGVDGTVLYPSWASNSAQFNAPPARLGQTGGMLTCAYGGSINSDGCARTLRLLAESLTSVGGRLLVFGPTGQEAIRTMGLQLPNVQLRGLVTFQELIEQCRAEADILFAPMSFDPRDRGNMALCFPSKLADYTAMGLPLLIHAPPYASAARWVAENPGVAEVVTTLDLADLRAALNRIGLASHRLKLATNAISVGQRYFSFQQAQDIFLNQLATAGSS